MSRKWQGMKVFLALPAMHLLMHVFNVGPKCIFSFAKTVREKVAFLHFPWNFLPFRECEEVAETFRQCTFSFDSLFVFLFWFGSECAAVAAIQLRMRMRILTRPENSLATFNHQTQRKSCEFSVAKEFTSECEGFCE